MLGQSVHYSHLTNDTKQEDWNFQMAHYTPISERTPAPMMVCNEKQQFPFCQQTSLITSPMGCPLPNAQWAEGVCMDFGCLKPTPNVFFLEKPDW